MKGTKSRIIQFAREKYFALGFSKVTMDELCGELGISKKTMYEYFKSKDELLDAVIEWQFISVKSRMNETLQNSTDFIDRIYQIWITIGRMTSQISKQFHEDIRKFRPDLWKKINDYRSEHILANFSKMIDEGVRHGFIRDDINKDIMVLIYLGSVQSIVNPEIISQHSFSTEEAFKGILQVYFDGILTEDARQHFHKKILQYQLTR